MLATRLEDDGGGIYIYIYIYEAPSISSHISLVQASKIVVDSSKFSMLLLYIL